MTPDQLAEARRYREAKFEETKRGFCLHGCVYGPKAQPEPLDSRGRCRECFEAWMDIQRAVLVPALLDHIDAQAKALEAAEAKVQQLETRLVELEVGEACFTSSGAKKLEALRAKVATLEARLLKLTPMRCAEE